MWQIRRKVEDYRGLAILATNVKPISDRAFLKAPDELPLRKDA